MTRERNDCRRFLLLFCTDSRLPWITWAANCKQQPPPLMPVCCCGASSNAAGVQLLSLCLLTTNNNRVAQTIDWQPVAACSLGFSRTRDAADVSLTRHLISPCLSISSFPSDDHELKITNSFFVTQVVKWTGNLSGITLPGERDTQPDRQTEQTGHSADAREQLNTFIALNGILYTSS